MKSIVQAAKDALADGSAIVAGAVEIAAVGGEGPIRIWGGWGEVTIDGAVFTGIGDDSLVELSGGALGASSRATRLVLSAIDPETIDPDELDALGGATVTLWRLIFAGDGQTLLDATVWERGRLDQVTRDDELPDAEEQKEGEATISAEIETAARSLGRRGARMRSDADQRLVDPQDGFFKHTSFAAQKMLYWGGLRPTRAGDAVGGGSRGGGSERGNPIERRHAY